MKIARAYLTDIHGNAIGTCEAVSNDGSIVIQITRDSPQPLRVHFDTDEKQDAYSCMVVSAPDGVLSGDKITYWIDEVCQAITRGSTSLRAPPGRSTASGPQGSRR